MAIKNIGLNLGTLLGPVGQSQDPIRMKFEVPPPPSDIGFGDVTGGDENGVPIGLTPLSGPGGYGSGPGSNKSPWAGYYIDPSSGGNSKVPTWKDDNQPDNPLNPTQHHFPGHWGLPAGLEAGNVTSHNGPHFTPINFIPIAPPPPPFDSDPDPTVGRARWRLCNNTTGQFHCCDDNMKQQIRDAYAAMDYSNSNLSSLARALRMQLDQYDGLIDCMKAMWDGLGMRDIQCRKCNENEPCIGLERDPESEYINLYICNSGCDESKGVIFDLMKYLMDLCEVKHWEQALILNISMKKSKVIDFKLKNNGIRYVGGYFFVIDTTTGTVYNGPGISDYNALSTKGNGHVDAKDFDKLVKSGKLKYFMQSNDLKI